ncbi:hypothetical protein PPERSA_10199 [Pseudocohnilembus persalinus]|uniref:Uncharacterized protein n=1 Tax=Pseudocohnilembus persalinus TaxID=266149 RepID=A0A0V0QLJ3_PSEPJ|nr:hypothetical protein PPERSA_10199 [Pseudocohnilembus persalinus]|eukprot:KRX03118.1 hypothetical protein PPERSA_10199 [Pseudocohnilembus persalinus]
MAQQHAQCSNQQGLLENLSNINYNLKTKKIKEMNIDNMIRQLFQEDNNIQDKKLMLGSNLFRVIVTRQFNESQKMNDNNHLQKQQQQFDINQTVKNIQKKYNSDSKKLMKQCLNYCSQEQSSDKNKMINMQFACQYLNDRNFNLEQERFN